MLKFYMPVTKRTLCSLIVSCLMLLAYQPPNYGNNKQFDTRTSEKAVNRTSINGKYTPLAINYFLEVAMGTEYEGSSSTIKKWDRDIRIKVIGSPTPEDLTSLQAVIDEINILTSGNINLSYDANNPNLEIYFVPVSQFAKYEPNYKALNYGFCWVGWNNDAIYKSRVLISTVGITQKERSHLIREELTQSLGLMRDSDRYADSIFYQGWTDSTEYAEIDKAVIKMLYRPEIRSGMSKAQVLEVLRTMDIQEEIAPNSDCRPTDANPALDFSVESFCDSSTK